MNFENSEINNRFKYLGGGRALWLKSTYAWRTGTSTMYRTVQGVGESNINMNIERTYCLNSS